MPVLHGRGTVRLSETVAVERVLPRRDVLGASDEDDFSLQVKQVFGWVKGLSAREAAAHFRVEVGDGIREKISSFIILAVWQFVECLPRGQSGGNVITRA